MYKYDKLFSTPLANLGDWVFDKKVAEVFPNMIQRSIPGYSNILSMIGMLAKRFVKPYSRVYDLGCSVGSVALILLDQIPHQHYSITAIDCSQFMVEKCNINVKTHKCAYLVEVLEDDICKVNMNNASMIIMNFTLQFIPLVERQALMLKIFNALNSGGILILSEKFNTKNKKKKKIFSEMYYDFKKSNGYKDIEINQKKKMLSSVMHTDTIMQHKRRLKSVGFKNTEIWFQAFNFGSFISWK